jgi:hypothetical protein
MRVPYESDIGPPPLNINVTNVALRSALSPHLLSYQVRGMDPNACGMQFVHLTVFEQYEV